MKIYKGIIVSAIALFALSFSFKAGAVHSFDDNYLLGRAIDIAGFSNKQTFDSYEISKSNLFEKGGEGIDLLKPGERVVNLFFKDGYPGSIKVKFIAPKYKVVDGDRVLEFSSFNRVVGDVLDDAGIILAKEDRVDPPLSAQIKNNLIKITRVEEAEIEEFETLPYHKKEILDPNLQRGLTTVTQAGSSGKKRLLYSVRRENGVEVSRVLKNSEIIDEPVDQITKVGTKVVVLSSISGEASWTKGVTAMRKYSRGTLIRITNLENGKKVETRVGGWGPQPYTGRILDLAQDEFDQIASLGQGTTNVLVEEIRE